VKVPDQVTLSQLIFSAEKTLAASGIENARREAEILLAYYLGISYQKLLTNLVRTVSDQDRTGFFGLVDRRRQKEPLQYITGRQEFMSLDFVVNHAVLVPRWDTERLVELVLDNLKLFSEPLVVDVGTGSGAIAVSLAKYFPRGKYFAVDISAGALEVAKRNAQFHRVDDIITFVQGDLLAPFLNQENFKLDFVVSNPPYIVNSERNLLPADVQKEPWLALDGGDDGLDYYRQLIPEACHVLRPGGKIFLEIGCDQGKDIAELCRAKGFAHVQVHQDYGCRDRVVSGSLKR